MNTLVTATQFFEPHWWVLFRTKHVSLDIKDIHGWIIVILGRTYLFVNMFWRYMETQSCVICYYFCMRMLSVNGFLIWLFDFNRSLAADQVLRIRSEVHIRLWCLDSFWFYLCIALADFMSMNHTWILLL